MINVVFCDILWFGFWCRRRGRSETIGLSYERFQLPYLQRWTHGFKKVKMRWKLNENGWMIDSFLKSTNLIVLCFSNPKSVKDMNILGRKISKVVVLEASSLSHLCSLNMDNSILIEPYEDVNNFQDDTVLLLFYYLILILNCEKLKYYFDHSPFLFC